MRFFIFSLISLALLGLPAQATQIDGVTIQRGDLIRLLKELPEVAPIRGDMERLGFAGENLELAVHQYNSFYRDDQIAGYLADRVLQVYESPETALQAGGLAQPLILRGLGHLPLQEMHYYYRVEQALLNGLSERDCGRIVRNRLSPQEHSDTMGRVTARMETKDLREFYRVERKAVHLGLDHARVRLTPEELSRIEAVIEKAFQARVQADPEVGGLAATLGGLQRLDNGRACQLGRIFYSTVLDLKGRDLRDGLIYLGLP